MFAIELMLPEVSVATFLPVALATGGYLHSALDFLGLTAGLERRRRCGDVIWITEQAPVWPG